MFILSIHMSISRDITTLYLCLPYFDGSNSLALLPNTLFPCSIDVALTLSGAAEGCIHQKPDQNLPVSWSSISIVGLVAENMYWYCVLGLISKWSQHQYCQRRGDRRPECHEQSDWSVSQWIIQSGPCEMVFCHWEIRHETYVSSLSWF